MKKIRKVKRGARKRARKDAEKALQSAAAMFLDHPRECCVCADPFERTKETVISWQVVTRENRVRLTCPNCWALVETVVKEDPEE